MHYHVYILKTTVYRASVRAETQEEAAEKLSHDPEKAELQPVDSWWDIDSIEAEEELYPEETGGWSSPE